MRFFIANFLLLFFKDRISGIIGQLGDFNKIVVGIALAVGMLLALLEDMRNIAK